MGDEDDGWLLKPQERTGWHVQSDQAVDFKRMKSRDLFPRYPPCHPVYQGEMANSRHPKYAGRHLRIFDDARDPRALERLNADLQGSDGLPEFVAVREVRKKSKVEGTWNKDIPFILGRTEDLVASHARNGVLKCLLLVRITSAGDGVEVSSGLCGVACAAGGNFKFRDLPPGAWFPEMATRKRSFKKLEDKDLWGEVVGNDIFRLYKIGLPGGTMEYYPRSTDVKRRRPEIAKVSRTLQRWEGNSVLEVGDARQ